MGAVAAAPPGPTRGTLAHRVRVFGICALVVGILLVSAGVVAFFLVLGERRDLADRIDPAQSASLRYLTALIEQESAVRGYLLTGHEAFVAPYASQRLVEQEAAGDVQRLLASFPSLTAAWRRPRQLAAEWRRLAAEPAMAGANRGSDLTRALAAGVTRFARFRAEFDRFSEELEAARRDVRRRLNRATVLLVAALVPGAVAVVVFGTILGRSFQNLVAGPLEQLGDDGQHVAGGDLSHAVKPVGPEEVARLGTIMEDMRARIVAELEAVLKARAELEAKAAELSRSNAELEQFAYVASHDLQEPLRKVASFCQMLERRYGDQLDDRARQYIGFAVDGAKRMQQLINDLLAFSRVGRRTEPPQDADCSVALERALDNLRVALDEAGAVVTADALPVVRGDMPLLVALFQNLVENGVKFRRPGVPPEVHVGVERTDGEWQFAVRDNGIGIDAQHADRVFVIFQRLHVREEYPGTGIGLALCRKIVEYHGGRIWIDPASGEGTTVRWTLPTPDEPNPRGPEA